MALIRRSTPLVVNYHTSAFATLGGNDRTTAKPSEHALRKGGPYAFASLPFITRREIARNDWLLGMHRPGRLRRLVRALLAFFEAVRQFFRRKPSPEPVYQGD